MNKRIYLEEPEPQYTSVERIDQSENFAGNAWDPLCIVAYKDGKPYGFIHKIANDVFGKGGHVLTRFESGLGMGRCSTKRECVIKSINDGLELYTL